MRRRVVMDTGPLVAFLNRNDRHHQWAREQLEHIEPPLISCEPVLSEACFLLRRLDGGPSAVLELVRRGLIAPSRATRRPLFAKTELERFLQDTTTKI